MKKVLLSLALAFTMTAIAQDSEAPSASTVQQFICLLNNGVTVSWQITEQPKVELKSGQFVISSTRETVYYAAEDVNRFTLYKEPLAIKPIQANQAKMLKTVTGQLLFTGCKAGEKITVYTLDGRQMLSQHADHEGTIILSIETLPTSVYLVKSKSINLKFMKK